MHKPDEATPPSSGRGRRAGAHALAATAGAVAVLLVGAPAAHAHDRLLRSEPADGSVVEDRPTQAVLTFSADIEQVGTAVELQDESGQAAAETSSTVRGRDVVTELPGDLQGGGYTLVYRVTSSDGHPISGQVAFTLTATGSTGAPIPSGDQATASASAAAVTPSPAATSAGPALEAAEPTAPATADADFPWTPVLLVLAALLLGGGAVGFLVRRPGSSRSA